MLSLCSPPYCAPIVSYIMPRALELGVEVFSLEKIHQVDYSHLFQIMASHTKFNYSQWSTVMKHPFQLIGLVREPLAQFQSYFSYFDLASRVRKIFPAVPTKGAFDFFLRHYEDNYQVQLRGFFLKIIKNHTKSQNTETKPH